MNKYALPLVLALLTVVSCQFNKSVNVNLTSGLTTKGNGLRCDDVSLVVNEGEVTRNKFYYGETLEVKFNDISGFTQKDGGTHVGTRIIVLAKNGDTVLYTPDLFKDQGAVNVSPLLVKPSLVIARPMQSGNSYTLHIHIWDKKGTGTFDAKLDFSVVRNPNIHVQSSGVQVKEIVLAEGKTVLTSDEIPAGKQVDIFLQEVEGFQEENGMCKVGASLVATDQSGKVLINEPEMLNDDPVDPALLKDGFTSNLVLPTTIKGPVNIKLTLRDKIGSGSLIATMKLKVRN